MLGGCNFSGGVPGTAMSTIPIGMDQVQLPGTISQAYGSITRTDTGISGIYECINITYGIWCIFRLTSGPIGAIM